MDTNSHTDVHTRNFLKNRNIFLKEYFSIIKFLSQLPHLTPPHLPSIPPSTHPLLLLLHSEREQALMGGVNKAWRIKLRKDGAPPRLHQG